MENNYIVKLRLDVRWSSGKREKRESYTKSDVWNYFLSAFSVKLKEKQDLSAMTPHLAKKEHKEYYL